MQRPAPHWPDLEPPGDRQGRWVCRPDTRWQQGTSLPGLGSQIQGTARSKVVSPAQGWPTQMRAAARPGSYLTYWKALVCDPDPYTCEETTMRVLKPQTGTSTLIQRLWLQALPGHVGEVPARMDDTPGSRCRRASTRPGASPRGTLRGPQYGDTFSGPLPVGGRRPRAKSM